MWRDLDRTCDEFAKFSRRDADAFRRMMAEYERGEGRSSAPPAHADRARAVARRAARRAPALAPPRAHERVGRRPGPLRGPAHAGVAALDGDDDGAAARPAGHGPARVVARLRPDAALVDAASRRLRRAAGRALPPARGARRDAAARPPGRRRSCSTAAAARASRPTSGERYLARKAVLSTIHVKHLVEMAPPSCVGRPFVEGVAEWRAGVSMFVTHYATTEPPRLRGQ